MMRYSIFLIAIFVTLFLVPSANAEQVKSSLSTKEKMENLDALCVEASEKNDRKYYPIIGRYLASYTKIESPSASSSYKGSSIRMWFLVEEKAGPKLIKVNVALPRADSEEYKAHLSSVLGESLESKSTKFDEFYGVCMFEQKTSLDTFYLGELKTLIRIK